MQIKISFSSGGRRMSSNINLDAKKATEI